MPYTVKLEATDINLNISVLQAQTAGRFWRSDFKSTYLEEICRKTGQAKPYIEFIQLLKEAFEQTNVDVYVDLLNLSDLQLLKGQRRSEIQQEDTSVLQKRYLIVTQLFGEKKFHYPLPLAPVDTSDVRLLDKETMRFVIKNMGQTLKNN